MTELSLVTGTIRRERGSLPQLPLVNLFPERAVTEPRQFSLLSFPGLTVEGTEMGSGPVIALFQRDGVLSGGLFGVSGGSLFAGETELGLVAGSGAASIAGNQVGVISTAGQFPVFWSGTAFSTIATPDLANVVKVFEQAGRFGFILEGTQRFYWTEPLDEMLNGGGEIEIDGLNFASAESEPDSLVDAVPFEDALALGGTATIEFWARSGDAELPYIPSTGRVFQKGVRATGCMAAFDNTIAWVSPDHIVYRAGNIPERISEPGIEELIEASATCRVDAYFFEGHELLKIKLDGLTIEYDAQTRQWIERRTGVGMFRGGPVVTGPLFGSIIDGTIYELSGRTDILGYQERSFCVWQPISGGTLPIDNLMLRTNPGDTEHLTGDYTNPTIEFIQSWDGGRTFDTPIVEHLGEQGAYRREIEWRALGFADMPGFFAKFRVTDPVDVRISGVAINEAQGGRSR